MSKFRFIGFSIMHVISDFCRNDITIVIHSPQSWDILTYHDIPWHTCIIPWHRHILTVQYLAVLYELHTAHRSTPYSWGASSAARCALSRAICNSAICAECWRLLFSSNASTSLATRFLHHWFQSQQLEYISSNLHNCKNADVFWAYFYERA